VGREKEDLRERGIPFKEVVNITEEILITEYQGKESFSGGFNFGNLLQLGEGSRKRKTAIIPTPRRRLTFFSLRKEREWTGEKRLLIR